MNPGLNRLLKITLKAFYILNARHHNLGLERFTRKILAEVLRPSAPYHSSPQFFVGLTSKEKAFSAMEK